MRSRTSHLFRMASILAFVITSHTAYAYYPMGAFSTQSQELVIPKWPLSYMDTNRDGDISGPNEGIPITFETGNLGFSGSEIDLVKSAFKTWSDVPTAFIGFRYTDVVPNLPDSLELSADIGAMDYFNYVAKETTGDTQVLPSGVAGMTFITSTVDATQIYIDGNSYDINGGTILDVDIALSDILANTNLAGAATVNIGYMLGLAANPLGYNLRGVSIRTEDGYWPLAFYLPEHGFKSIAMWENPHVQLRDASGQLKNFGVTPSMFPYLHWYAPGPVLAPTRFSADFAYVSPTKSVAELEAELSPLPKTTFDPYLTGVGVSYLFLDFAGQNMDLMSQPPKNFMIKVSENFPAGLSTANLFTDYLVDGQYRVYRTELQSQDALGLRWEVDLATLRPEEELWVIDPTVRRSFGPFARTTGVRSYRWLPWVQGDTTALVVRSTGTEVPDILIERGSHYFRSMDDVAKELGCYVNIACETDPTLQKISTGIGLIDANYDSGGFAASGSLLNNPDTATLEPYFLTANHVIGDIETALTCEIFWDYRIATCTGVSPPALASLPRSAVTELLATLQPLDGTLVKLDSVPVGTLGRAYLGWDFRLPSTKDGENRAVGISHPRHTHMRISKGKIASIANEVPVNEFGPVMGMIECDFDSGVVEPGSSGSPLMYDDGSYRVLGMLSNGDSSQTCETSPYKANYGSFRDFFPFIAGYLTGTPAPTPEDRCGQEGARDLAPDDIAALSDLYPRKGEDVFFSFQQEARTHTNGQTLPSVPIAGGLILAYCDTDNDPSTSRIPVFSTLTSLYQVQNATRGRFDMKGLYKQFETSAGGLFDATYTFTVSPIYSPLWLHLSLDPKSYDSTHDGSFVTGGLPGFSFSSGYPSEVFHENGNLLDESRYDEGTPLKYDRIRRQVISADSMRALSTILPGTKPMFGDGVSNCPYAVASIGLSSSKGPDALRALRDRYLLHSAIGAALVDVYYHVGPSLAEYLLTHATAWRVAHAAAASVEWSLSHSVHVVTAALVLMFMTLGGLKLMRRRMVRRSTLLALALSAPFLFESSASAQLLQMNNEQMVAASNDIVTGEVVAVESHWNDRKQIVTDVTIKVNDVIKGKVNKDGHVSLQVPGGRVGGIVTRVTFMPAFSPQEKVVVFLENRKNAPKNAAASPLIVGGTRGKLEITEDATTKAAYVTGGSEEAQLQIAEANAEMAKESKDASATPKDMAQSNEKIALSDYTQYLRSIVAKQKNK